jgi:hypothetical protein
MFVSQIIDEASEILGTSDQTKVYRVLTQAVQSLMETGHWFHSNQVVDVCTGWDGYTITLPREIEVPLAVNIDGSPTYFRNRFFEFHVNKGGMYSTVDWAWDDRGFVATQMDIKQPAQLIAIAETDNDVGKYLRVLGVDQNNVSLRDQTQDGVGVDGMIIPIHSQSDFALGTIQPEQEKVTTRTAAISPFETFTTSDSSNHTLVTGERVQLTSVSGNVPAELNTYESYFVGVANGNTISLYNDQLDALNGRYPIQLSSIEGTENLILQDTRIANLLTQIQMASAPTTTLPTGVEVTFSGSSLPAPLDSNTTYFAVSTGGNNIQIFASLLDATNNQNPIYLSGTYGTLNVTVRKPISAQTTLQFNSPHYFVTGDMVQANNNGGVLPSPLVLAQNYYAHVIDPSTITLHTNYNDSVTGNNPISLLTDGTGENSIVKLITATVSQGTTNNIKATINGLTTPSGTGAAAQAVVSGSITAINITNGGSGYTATPTITFDTTGGAGYTSTPTAILVTSSGTGGSIGVTLTSDYVSSISINSAGTGYAVGESIEFVGGGGTGARGHITSIDSSGAITGITLDQVGSGLTAVVLYNTISNVVNGIEITSAGTGYESAPRATISGGGGTGATASCVLTTSQVSRFVVTNGGSGYTTTPAATISGGGGSGAYGTAVISGGQVVAVNVIAEGAGYSSAPSVAFVASTGCYVQFSSDGTLPTGLAQGVVYRAEAPFSGNSFTVMNTDFSPVTISDSGAGTLYLVLSRAFGVGFTNYWQGDFSGYNTGDTVYFGTDYLLPQTSPAISAGTSYYINVSNGATSCQIYDSQSDAEAGGTTGLITIIGLGTGQTYLGQQIGASVITPNNILILSDLSYLQAGASVTFSSTSQVPSPLIAGNNYTIQFFQNGVQVYDSSSNLISFTDIGSGQLTMSLQRNFIPDPSTSIVITGSLFETGDAIYPRPQTNDILDPSLVAGNAYYIRKISADNCEIYDTQAHAINTQSTQGRLSFVTTGNSVNSTFFVDVITPAVFVKQVKNIDKPLTDGRISLYAWDYGRSNDVTLIGQYHPSETNPQYRRIRVGKPCAWARILYRTKAPVLSSPYDYIPLEQPRAIIAAVHAIDLENKDFADQSARYWQIALGYLKNQESSMAGHAMEPPQINGLTYGDTTDPIMF